MKRLFAAAFVLSLTSGLLIAQTDSYQKHWLLQARERERTRKERRKHYESLSAEARLKVSDLEEYPTKVMTFGKGFSNGLAKITVNGKAGFIDPAGRIVIPAKFRDAGHFSEGLAPFEDKTGKWGFIDPKGKVVILPTFDWALSFREERALIQIKDKWGYIDRTGKVIVKPQFDHAGSFSEGLAQVQLYMVNDAYADKRQTYKSGYIDKNGVWIIEPKWDGGEDFRDGLAKVGRDKFDENRRYRFSEAFFIDKTGRLAFDKDVSGGWSFYSEGLYVKEENGLYEVVDKAGKDVIDEIYDYLIPFSEGLAYFKNDGKKGFIDRKGKVTFYTDLDVYGGFKEGLAVVSDSRRRYGYIDKSGVVKIPLKFDSAFAFHEGFALVAENRKTDYLDKAGKYIWKPTE